MKWSKKNKELILEIIRHEKSMLKTKLYHSFFGSPSSCPFCKLYYTYFSYCKPKCPNKIINKLLNIRINKEFGFPCLRNAKYIGIDFYEDADVKLTSQNIKKRINFWKDTLILTKREFLKIYKEINAQHKTIPA